MKRINRQRRPTAGLSWAGHRLSRAEHLIRHARQLVEGERFLQPGGDAIGIGQAGAGLRLAADEDERGAALAVFTDLEEFEEPRRRQCGAEPLIAKDRIELFRAEQGEGSLEIPGLGDNEAFALEQTAHGVGEGLVVLDDQHSPRGFGHAP